MLIRSRYTSGRTLFLPLGNVGYYFVRKGNVLFSRVLLLLLVASARGSAWLVEQPFETCVEDQRRWEWFIGIVRVALLVLISFFYPKLNRTNCKAAFLVVEI